MSGPFETEKEAGAALEHEEHAPLWFCPLINGSCNRQCWCFGKPRIGRCGSKYFVKQAYCGNAMFSEERIVTNQY